MDENLREKYAHLLENKELQDLCNWAFKDCNKELGDTTKDLSVYEPDGEKIIEAVVDQITRIVSGQE